jgi:sugar phosphate permease
MAYGAQFSFGVFFSAMLEEFGWSRAALSGAFALYAFGYSVFSAVAGRLTDRWGPRAVIATGGVFLGAGWLAMSTTSALWHPYVFYGVVAALGMSTANVPCGATVARWPAATRPATEWPPRAVLRASPSPDARLVAGGAALGYVASAGSPRDAQPPGPPS